MVRRLTGGLSSRLAVSTPTSSPPWSGRNRPSCPAIAEARSIADTLIGAVSDHGEAAYHAPLTRFQAVVSNLNRSFLAREQRVRLSQPLAESCPRW